MKRGKTKESSQTNELGIVSVVLGIVGVSLFPLGILASFVGFWFGLKQHKIKKNNWSVWGMSLNIIAFIASLSYLFYVALKYGQIQ